MTAKSRHEKYEASEKPSTGDHEVGSIDGHKFTPTVNSIRTSMEQISYSRNGR